MAALFRRQPFAMNDAGRSIRRRDAWRALAVVGAVFVVLTALTWRKWPDVLVDFGLQLYCPWKLSTGSVLYRDIAYLVGGPLSQYYHAFLFRIFGTSFLTLVVSNLFITAVLLAAIYDCFYQSANQVTAVVACLAVVTAFAFAHNTPSGIFNYITPYCSEVVHGLVLSVIAVALLAAWIREGKLRLAAAAGFCCGLVFLTKPEVFLGLAISVCAGLALFWRATKKSGLLFKSVGMMLAAGLVPIVVFFIYFLCATDFTGAWRGVCAGWIPVLAARASGSQYFRWCMGLDTPGLHLQRMFIQAFGVAVVVAVVTWACRRNGPKALPWVVAAGLAALAWKFNWVESGRCLPILCLVALAMLLWRARVSGLEPSAIFPILWSIFSLGLLFKLGLFSRIWHYGFVLGMPAFLCAIYLLLWLLPRELERLNVQSAAVRVVFCVPLLVGLAALTKHSLTAYSWKTVPIGNGADKMWTYNAQFRPEGVGAGMALRWVETNTPPQATVAVLPAGVMINYLSRRANPTRYPVWAPPEVAALGQDKMTGDFIRHSPDYVILVGISFDEFGEHYFGTEDRFGRGVMTWIDAHYQQKLLIGDDWLKTGRFGLRILQKAPP